MKLKKSRKLVNGRFTITLTVSNFTILEVRAMKAIGEPQFVFNETYKTSGTEINIDMPITRFVNQSFVFAGNVENICNVSDEVQRFCNDIFEALVEVIADTVGEYERLLEFKDDAEEEIEVFPEEEYPDNNDIAVNPEKPAKPNKPNSSGNKYDDGCGCGIRIWEEVPEDVTENKIFGVILDDDDEEEAEESQEEGMNQ